MDQKEMSSSSGKIDSSKDLEQQPEKPATSEKEEILTTEDKDSENHDEEKKSDEDTKEQQQTDGEVVTGSFVRNEAGEVVPIIFLPVEVNEDIAQNYQVFKVVECFPLNTMECNNPDEAVDNISSNDDVIDMDTINQNMFDDIECIPEEREEYKYPDEAVEDTTSEYDHLIIEMDANSEENAEELQRISDQL